MYPILVPYHLDEHLPALIVPLEPEVKVERELPAGDMWSRTAVLYRPLADAVTTQVARGNVPVVQSGDCNVSFGTVAGLQHAGLTPSVVWFDAHGDVQTLETTTSGYLGGLPLRILAGYRPELISSTIGLRPIPPERIVLVDARDQDPPEQRYLELTAVQQSTVEALTPNVLPPGPIYLHLDLDVIRPEDLPGQLFPAAGGPAIRAVADAVGRVIGTGRVAAVGLACTWREDAQHAADLVRPIVDALR